MSIEHLIQQESYTDIGYSPVIDYGAAYESHRHSVSCGESIRYT